jgi:hypothetical protein
MMIKPLANPKSEILSSKQIQDLNVQGDIDGSHLVFPLLEIRSSKLFRISCLVLSVLPG